MAWKNKHSKLLEDQKVLDWYKTGRRTSVLNADVSLRNLWVILREDEHHLGINI